MGSEVKKFPIVKDGGSDPTVLDIDTKAEKTWSCMGRSWCSEGDSMNKKKNPKNFVSKFKKLEKGTTSSGQSMKLRKWPWCNHIQVLNDNFTRMKTTGSNMSCHSQVLNDSLTRMKTTGSSVSCRSQGSDPPQEDRAFEPQTSSDPDEVDHLFISYAFTFRRLGPRRQAKLKVALASLFADAELEEMM